MSNSVDLETEIEQLINALELAMALQERFGVQIQRDTGGGSPA